jgi:hypothetical protein
MRHFWFASAPVFGPCFAGIRWTCLGTRHSAETEAGRLTFCCSARTFPGLIYLDRTKRFV